MSYANKSIRDMIMEIEDSQVYLPALQRKFVWGKHQIQLLFDSIMRNFPIGTFLFWKLQADKADSYVFYEFLKEYDERHPYNRKKTGSFTKDFITGVLDGQQRLSSMYIGLQGTHTEKEPYKRRTSDHAYPITHLYLNVLSLPYRLTAENTIVPIEELNFEFRFLTPEDAEKWTTRKVKDADNSENEEVMYWFKVGDVLSRGKFGEDPEFDVIIDGFLASSKNELQKEKINSSRRFIRKSLETLHSRIWKDKLINYFEVTKDDLEDILKIFIRVNSGGTQLNKTDLLFSTIIATWENGRDEIEGLLKLINAKGEKFNFSNEYIMRCCLVLTDAPVLYKVHSFKSDSVQKIKDEWKKISESVSKTVDLLVEFGFSGSLLTSQNATIIIAYYIFKGGNLSAESKSSLKKYLVHALLTGIYGSSQDSLIATLRNAFRVEEKSDDGTVAYKARYTSFSFDELLKINLPSRKSLYVSDTEIDEYLKYKKGSASFFLLTLLYPNLRYKEVAFHQDHIHPASRFNKKVFDELQLTDEQRSRWSEYRDMVPNLQLLEGRQNESKNATEFKKWISAKDDEEQKHFCQSNYIPDETSFEFKNFEEFFEARKNKLRNELKKVLAISNQLPVQQEEDNAEVEELDSSEMLIMTSEE